ncbi:MAG: PAS domain S-box protein, partial [Anaerolineae bacterium]
ISPVVGATLSVTSLWLGGIVSETGFVSVWWLWWLESATGVLLLAPVVLVWGSQPLPRWRGTQLLEAGILFLLVVLVEQSIYGQGISTDISNALTYSIFPLVIWAAIGFGQHGVVTVALLVAGIAVRGTILGYGPFYVLNSYQTSLLLLYGFTTAVSVMGMLLAASLSEYKSTADALGVSESKFRTLFDSASDAIFIHDLGGRFLEVNEVACRRLDYSHEELLQMSTANIEPLEHALTSEERLKSLREGEQALFEVAHRRRDGSLIPVELNSRIIEYEGRTAVLTVARDISARKRLEEQLRQSQKMSAIGRLAGGIAHDFNNFLTVINGFSALVLKSMPESDPMHHGMELIAQTGERAAGLIRKLLAFSRQQPVEMRVLDLNHVLEEMTAMLDRLIGEDVELRIDTDPYLDSVKADPGQIEQVIVNLAANARDAMPMGGVLTIETENVWLDGEYIARHPEVNAGAFVRLSVRDTGVGMSDEVRSHLFEPFFTTKGKEKGTGLGLPIVYGIVTQSGGHIDVHSELGQGTRIDVYLSRVEESLVLSSTEGQEVVLRGEGERILVVEDEEGVRGLVAHTLRELGYVVVEASQATAALDIHASCGGEIDLVLTDIVMPGMSGPEMVVELHKRQRNLPVLYMSGHTHETMLRYGIPESGIPLVQKPFDIQRLAMQVRQALGACKN